MSNYYLCETCDHRVISCPKDRVCWYKYAECAVLGIVRMPVMHDGIECPTDLCEHYERKGADGR